LAQCCVASANVAAGGTGEGDSGEATVDTPTDGVVPEEESRRDAANGLLDRRAPPNRGHEVYAAAARWIGTPYVWGGGNCNGPTKGGFDCSGKLSACCAAKEDQNGRAV
jgi:cell wall-associated NlpC family hydrolase